MGVGIVLQLIYIRGILLLSTLWRSELANLFLAGFGLISPLIFQRRFGLVHSWINQMMPICIKIMVRSFQDSAVLFWVL